MIIPDLAIVIPAYKATYLFEALQSLQKQTSQLFTVYIGDDNSPEDLKIICDQFKGHISLDYHHFATNMGGTNLVQHWMRCVALKQNEKWIWLFSDDDIAEEYCVEKFYQALEKTAACYDVYRFNTMVIDEKGTRISEAQPSPEIENPMNLACEILLWNRGNSMPDHIFSAAKYAELNGFVDFAFAQGSDWASSINYSYPKGLFTIGGPKVKWRMSSSNVSAVHTNKRTAMMMGHLQFLEWILQRFSTGDQSSFGIQLSRIRSAALHNLEAVFRRHYRGVPFADFLKVVKRTSEVFNISQLAAFRICAEINYRVYRPKFRAAVKRLIIPAKA
ncbi:MAG: glycosyltransferase [Chitinophagaceae bacterium]